MKWPIERRKRRRFYAETGAAAVFRRPWPDASKLGQIIDISMDGLAFRYIARGEQVHGSYQLEIVWGDCSARCENIPFKVISELNTPNEAPLNSIEMRRGRVQFGKLRPDQISKLEYFIQNHTTGEV